MNNSSTLHLPVLKNEVITYLNPRVGDWVIDATLGLGGHAELILQKIGPKGLLVGIDQDACNIKTAKDRLKAFPNVLYVHDNFENLEEIVQEVCELKKEKKRISGILFDLGVSSVHLDQPARGFSFQKEGPLDMRFDTRQKITAAEIVNKWPIKTLIHIFKNYGEERYSRQIAQAIIKRRKTAPFVKTTELAEFISNIVRSRDKKHPATRTFQALRIAVNHELEALEKGLVSAVNLINIGGRIVTISFHSLEDRIAKNIFRNYSKSSIAPILKLLTKKPIEPSEEECRENPRARSAKLRAIERIL